MNFVYKGFNVEKKTKKSLIVNRLFILDNSGELCHTHAYIDLMWAEMWQCMHKVEGHKGMEKDRAYSDAIGKLLVQN